MKKYEYKIIDQRISEKNKEEQINELTTNGWELFKITDPFQMGVSLHVRMYFRIELVEIVENGNITHRQDLDVFPINIDSEKALTFPGWDAVKGQKVIFHLSDEFVCKGCEHALPLSYCIKTEGYCHLCDPNVTVEELTDGLQKIHGK
jgi:hypothetical protein